MKGQRVGYIRVSSVDQNVDRQLEGVDVDRTFIDRASGRDASRPQLEALLSFIREGDTLVVHSMDLRFNDPVELEAGMLATDSVSARATVARSFGALATRIGKGALILNGGDYLSLMRKEGPLIEVL